jgi:chromosome segregation ATPase
MSNPIAIVNELGNDAARLDELDKLLDTAIDALDAAEDRWLEVRDKVAESLKDEMEQQGRKGDPAEHWVDTQARRENRLAWTNYRRAKRAVERIREQIKAKTSAMSGRQSQLRAQNDGHGQWTPPVRALR